MPVTSRPVPFAVSSTRGRAVSARSDPSARSRGDSTENRESASTAFPSAKRRAPSMRSPSIVRLPRPGLDSMSRLRANSTSRV